MPMNPPRDPQDTLSGFEFESFSNCSASRGLISSMSFPHNLLHLVQTWGFHEFIQYPTNNYEPTRAGQRATPNRDTSGAKNVGKRTGSSRGVPVGRL
ncbi:hypothetical protein PoB_006479700 [Plakobranchus ocellatus]|uniref:Uncharacterized protein n=1 Tax=Plakobranchus ocellatus TaxID=259542 RepID=A0AAV4D290_9GAST|nr:hypothetical protein PoB_006479700 [Plakobranchus ocellatus]